MPYALAEKEIDFELPDSWKMIGFPKRVRAFGINHAWRVIYRKASYVKADGHAVIKEGASTLITTTGVHSGQLLDWRYIP